MRKALVFAAILAASPAIAADKGAPATFEDIALKSSPTTCYVETSVAGTYLRSDREAQAGFGGGCDTKLATLILGGGFRADFSGWRDSGSVFVKMGMAINNGVNLYGMAEWKVPAWKIKAAGQLMLGAGTEIKLEIINPQLWTFIEAGVAATKFGPAVGTDDMTLRGGFRFKF